MPVSRPDIDKLARAVLDAMTGPIIYDDAQVVRLLVTKCYDLNPGVVIDVSQSGNFWADTHDNA
jgi:Holliday junction resolvase RusA-like endonuclease